jgi:molecular chaperone HscA
MLDATRSALAADGELLSHDERQAIDALMAAVDTARLHSSDAAAMEAATEALAKGTEAFAAARMNRSIAQALSGQRVDSL